jgi:hypothetical protein
VHGGIKDTSKDTTTDGSRVRVVLSRACHDQRYSKSVLLPSVIKPPDLNGKAGRLEVDGELGVHVNGGYSYDATHAGPSR